jgi:hypothetical protein
VLFALVGGAASALAADDRGKSEHMAIETTLAMEVTGKDVVAKLTFRNRSKEDQFIDKRMGVLDGDMTVPVFLIESDGRAVRSTILLSKFPGPGPDDYVKLGPEQQVSTTVRLSGAYDFSRGKHRYRIRYQAYHGRPDHSALVKLTSNSVEFELSR